MRSIDVGKHVDHHHMSMVVGLLYRQQQRPLTRCVRCPCWELSPCSPKVACREVVSALCSGEQSKQGHGW